MDNSRFCANKFCANKLNRTGMGVVSYITHLNYPLSQCVSDNLRVVVTILAVLLTKSKDGHCPHFFVTFLIPITLSKIVPMIFTVDSIL